MSRSRVGGGGERGAAERGRGERASEGRRKNGWPI